MKSRDFHSGVQPHSNQARPDQKHQQSPSIGWSMMLMRAPDHFLCGGCFLSGQCWLTHLGATHLTLTNTGLSCHWQSPSQLRIGQGHHKQLWSYGLKWWALMQVSQTQRLWWILLESISDMDTIVLSSPRNHL